MEIKDASQEGSSTGPPPPGSDNGLPLGYLTVAGIGASAGGIEALQAFFEVLPEKLGVAFVVVIHLSPEHRSYLAEILAAYTTMPVQQVQDNVPLKADHIYVIPPDRQLEITDTHISTSPFEEPRGQRAPVDTFFRSLAEQYGDGFAVILSGGGSDGAVGVKAIKEGGGLILVQEPQEALYPSMPQAAIATGVVDVVLPVRELALQLADLSRLKHRIHRTLGSEPPAPLDGNNEQMLTRILSHLHSRTGHDFSQYKRNTVLRRLGRRMQLNRKETLGDYLALLRHNVEEGRALFRELLISVTTFFRDPEAFEALQQKVITKLFEAPAAPDRLRVWVPACATGEEAYSLAILLLEEAERRGVWPAFQIFASDLDEGALATAREGRYPTAIEADISPERLQRFFVQEGDHYRVLKEVRDIMLFAKHNVLRDPPFSRIYLVSCRNLLIYLDRELQAQVFNVFHYALQPDGYLFLGTAETAEASAFRSLDKKYRLYQARHRTSMEAPRLPTLLLAPSRPLLSTAVSERPRREISTPAALHQKLLETLSPPSILVDENRNVLHLSETAGRFLQPSGGILSYDVADLVRPELRVELRAALYRALQQNEMSLSSFLPVQFDGTSRRVAVLVQPRPGETDEERLALVIFLEGDEVVPTEGLMAAGEAPPEILQQLQEALRQSQAQMKAMREQYEAANEEILATNEELQSLNEEYRTSVEELETTKEELQSLNEELETVNTELNYKLEELSLAHSDLQNLMAATEIATLFLDLDLHIYRFTPRLADLFSVTHSDLGRPITDFSHQLDYERLEDDVRQVLEHLMHLEREVMSRAERWYLVRLRPHRTVNNRIAGVVVTFVDITERKQAEEIIAATLKDTQILRDLSAQLVSEGDIQVLYDKILAAATALTRADAGTVQIFDESSQELVMLAAQGFAPHLLERFQRVDASSGTSCGLALASGERTFVDYDDPASPDPDGSRRVHLEAGYLSAQSTPLIARSGRCIGMFTTHWRTHHRPTEHELRFLDLLARQAADLIDRKHADVQLRQLASRLTMAEQAERHRISQILHDHLQQLLYGIQLKIGFINHSIVSGEREKLQAQATQIITLIDDAITLVRQLTVDLSPPALPQEGLTDALNWLVMQMKELYGLQIKIEAEHSFRLVDDGLRVLLFQIIRELLFNVVKHAETNRAQISLYEEAGWLVIQINDSGRGFDLEKIEAEPQNGFGLRNARERLELIGGRLELVSRPGKGTQVTMYAPLML